VLGPELFDRDSGLESHRRRLPSRLCHLQRARLLLTAMVATRTHLLLAQSGLLALALLLPQ
jgi:hypothetical protein